jgi:Na+/H+-dicarboxylate symporter
LSLTVRILIAVALGLSGGVVAGLLGPAWLGDASALARTIGTAWLDGLRMTIVPLVFALIVTGIASAADAAKAGAAAGRALTLFALGLVAAALVSAGLISGLLALWPVSANAVAELGGGVLRPDTQAGLTSEWLLSFIPSNPVDAAAKGEMVPLVVFALLFGFAATRIAEQRREGLLALFHGVVDTMLVLVQWVLALAPIGVFMLAFVAGSRGGLATAGALAHYVALVVIACVSVTLLVYPVVALFGTISIGRFARVALAPQAIAFSTQSSIASLPAMIAAIDTGLAVSERVRSIVLPMAVSVFRLTSASANIAVALFVAALYGIHLGPAQIILGALVAAVVSLAAVGLPSQVSFFTAVGPVCLALGVPLDVLPLLLAVETVPDIFRTVGNVTADLAVTHIAAARERG